MVAHCDILTREQDGTVSTIEGSELQGRPEGALGVDVIAGDSVGSNRPTDETYWWSPVLPWLDDAEAQTTITCLKAKAPQMHAAQLAYNFLGPNSNRAVVELTEACGITMVKWSLKPGKVPGYMTPFTPAWY